MGSLSLLQRIFLTQELNQGLLHCRQILYQLSHQGRPWMANGISDLTWPALSSDFHWAPSQAGNGSTQVLHVQFCMLHTAQECQAERQVGLKSSHVPLVESCAWVRGHICPKEGVPLLIPPKASWYTQELSFSPLFLALHSQPTNPLFHCALAHTVLFFIIISVLATNQAHFPEGHSLCYSFYFKLFFSKSFF